MDEKHYNFYDRRQECPHCGKLMFWDRNHSEQRCDRCHYEFCEKCLLPTHEQQKGCKEAIEKNKKIDTKLKVHHDTPAYSTCPECFTYGRKKKGTHIAKCAYCEKLFCGHCKEFFNKMHKCPVTPSEEVMKEIIGDLNLQK